MLYQPCGSSIFIGLKLRHIGGRVVLGSSRWSLDFCAASLPRRHDDNLTDSLDAYSGGRSHLQARSDTKIRLVVRIRSGLSDARAW